MSYISLLDANLSFNHWISGPETNDDTDPDNSDENDGAAKNESQPKIPARGLTAGARASVDQAHTGDEQKEGQ